MKLKMVLFRIVLCLSICATMCYTVFATNTNLLFVNGDLISDADVIIENETALVPLRVISEKLNASVKWNSKTKVAEIQKGNVSISVPIGKKYINVNGKTIETGVESKIINSLTYVPLRTISYCFGVDVEFYGVSSYQNNDNTEYNNSINIFEKLPSKFVFTAGVGNWSTEFDLSSDGTFTGKYTDLDMGDTGENFPNGTTYICKFNGKFSVPVKMDEHTYSMQLEYLDLAGVPGNIYYEDNMRYICSEAYGFDNAEEFLIYLPGTPISSLPEDFVSWLNSIAIIKGDTIPAENCGLYNVNGKEGFVGFYKE